MSGQRAAFSSWSISHFCDSHKHTTDITEWLLYCNIFFGWFQKNIVWIQNTRVWTIPSNQVMSTPDETKPWFMNWVGTSPIVIIWYFFKVPSQLNRRLGFINPGLTLNINVFLLWRKHRTKPWTFFLLVKQQKWTCQAAKRSKVSWTKWVWLNKCYPGGHWIINNLYIIYIIVLSLLCYYVTKIALYTPMIRHTCHSLCGLKISVRVP